MMRVFKNKPFARYARGAGIDDAALCRAVRDANNGVVDADLGGGVLKQRIARSGEGKSGGFRTILLFKIGDFACFVYGFAKNERSNIRTDELAAFKKLAAEMFAYDANALKKSLEIRVLTEVKCDEEAI